MATLYSDDFSGNLNDWESDSNSPPSTSDWQITSGELDAQSDQKAIRVTTGGHAATADVKVSVDIATTFSSFDGGPAGRITDADGSTEDLYYADVYSPNKVEIYRRVNGSDTQVATGNRAGMADGDTIRLEIEGTAIRCYVNDTLECSGTDSTHSTGQTGAFTWSTSNLYDNFLAEDFSAPPAGDRRVIMIGWKEAALGLLVGLVIKNPRSTRRGFLFPWLSRMLMRCVVWLFVSALLAPLSAVAEKTIDSDNFSYQGCIISPVELEVAGITYYPDGDSGGPADGYPGSLYLMSSGASGNEQVLEMTIPVPSIEASSGDCTEAATLRSLTTVGCNLDSMSNEPTSGGIAYYNDSGGVGEKLYWTIYEYYNAEGTNHDSAGSMNLDLTGCAGAWGMTGTGGDNTDGSSEPYHSHQWEDYIFKIHDEAWADTHLDSRYIVYGRHKEAGCCGGATGPALYAAAPWDDGDPIANNGNMDGQIMLAYPGTWGLSPSHYFPALFGDIEYRPTDRFSGGSWIRVGTEDSIVITGRKAQGDHWYGTGGDGCNTYQGFHADPYENRWWFYDPSDLECVIAGTCDSWAPTPYATHDPSGETYEDDCFNDTEWQGGAAFDDASDIFYVAETVWNGAGFDPIIHVYEVDASIQASPFISGGVLSGGGVGGGLQ